MQISVRWRPRVPDPLTVLVTTFRTEYLRWNTALGEGVLSINLAVCYFPFYFLVSFISHSSTQSPEPQSVGGMR